METNQITNPKSDALRDKLIALLRLPKSATDDAILSSTSEVVGSLERLELKARQTAAAEEQIAKKMSVGLSREQAIAVIDRQRKYDEQMANQKAPIKTRV